MSFFERAPRRRLLSVSCLLGLGFVLSACGGGSSRTLPTGPIGTATGVALSTSTGTPAIQQGANFIVTATVTNDVNSAGVTWSLNPATGGGTLSNITTSTVTYTAPTGVTGTTTPILTATSIADTTKTAAATLVVNGLPVIEATTLFPGNVGSPYGAAIVVDGGLAPFTWSLVDPTTLPTATGMTIATTATTAFTTVSGTPTATAAGTYNFQVKVVDANSNSATVPVTLVIKAAEACLLNGQYALLYTGYSSNSPTVGAASLNITSAGVITGTQDYKTKDATVAESVTGTCTTRTSNNGELKLTGTAHSPSYDYATTTTLDSGRFQLENGLDKDSGSGQLLQQDVTAFTHAALAGNFAFGALGAAPGDLRMALAGTLALDASGMVTSGRIDTNSATPLSGVALTGSMTAPDANGRAVLQLNAGSVTDHFAAYVVNANRLLLVSLDDGTTPRLAGYMTRQSGTFDSSALANPAVLSLWGAAPTGHPPGVLELGRVSNANTVAGTVDLNIDRALLDSGAIGQPYTGASYAVTSDGRFTLSFLSGTVTRRFVGYLDGASNGYLVEVGGISGSGGLLEAQAAAPFSSTLPGLFISGTQFPQDPGPITLLPAVHLAAGTLSASQANGYYALDTTTGRAIGSLNVTGSGSTLFVLYVVGPNAVRALRFGSASRSASLEWLGS